MQVVPFSYIKQAGSSLILPSDISNLNLWVKSDVGVLDTSGGSISNGEEVGTWQDQSSNGFDLTRTIALSDGPTYDDVSYSYPVLTSGDTITQVMGRTTGTIQQNPMTISMAFILHEAGTAVNDVIFSSGTGGGTGNEYLICKSINAGVSSTFWFKNNAPYAFTFNFDTPYFMQIVIDDVIGGSGFRTIWGYLNGSLIFTNIYAPSVNDGIALFNSKGQTLSPAISLMEFFVHGKDLSIAEIGDMETYINNRYSIF